MIWMLIKALFGKVVDSFFKLFTINRDEQIGALKEQNKTMAGGIEDVQKVHDARNDPDALQRVRDKYQRD